MTLDSRIQAVKAIADHNPDGFTVNVTDLTQPTQGYAVAYTHGMNLADAVNIAGLLTYYSGRQWYVGGWRDGNDFIVDVSTVEPFEDAARAIGALYHQVAVFNLATKESITL
jgi:hypothetical protein